jgi:hypothetical protein
MPVWTHSDFRDCGSAAGGAFCDRLNGHQQVIVTRFGMRIRSLNLIGEQFGQADEVIGRHRESELPIDPSSPRWRILREPATALAQPKASSMRLRMRC